MNLICDYDECLGCGVCAAVCPKQAITMKIDEKGFLSPAIYKDLCIDCELCKRKCTVNNIAGLNKNVLQDAIPYQGWSRNDEIRLRSSSGGVFGQIAHDLLLKGGIVYGVDFSENRAFHRRITSISELSEIQNTKYVQSDASFVYKDVKEDILKGCNVLFSGTPCQIGALYTYLGEIGKSENLFTIEVICHGVPSYLALDNSLVQHKQTMVVSFRNKKNGWGYHSQCMHYKDDKQNDTWINREEDLFYRLFFSEKLLRQSCYSCPFAEMPRVADLTIGDCWNTKIKDENELFKGVSLLIVNNKKSLNMVSRNENLKLEKIGWFNCIYPNRNIYSSYPSFLSKGSVSTPSFFKENTGTFLLSSMKLGYNEIVENNTLIERLILKVCNKLIYQILEIGSAAKYKHIVLFCLKMKAKINKSKLYSHFDIMYLNFITNLYRTR